MIRPLVFDHWPSGSFHFYWTSDNDQRLWVMKAKLHAIWFVHLKVAEKTHMPKKGIPDFSGNNVNCQTAQSLHLPGFVFVVAILPKSSKINKRTHDVANMSRFDVDWPFAFVCTKAVTLPSPLPTLWQAIGGHSLNILVSLLVSSTPIFWELHWTLCSVYFVLLQLPSHSFVRLSKIVNSKAFV